MKYLSFLTRTLQISFDRTTITFGASWWIAGPVGVWAIGAIYVPLIGVFLNPVERWSVTLVIALLSGVSLVGHAMAHMMAARWLGDESPSSLPLYPLGDAAQVWPAAFMAWREGLIALTGPLMNLLLSSFTYLLWNMQADPYLNVITLFLVFFNSGLAVINLIPVFPLDGGRLMRAISWGLLGRPAAATRWGASLGLLTAALLVGWGIILIAQRARFSWQTGATTLLFAGLIALPLLVQPLRKWDRSEPPLPARWSIILVRGPIAGLLFLSMLGITIGLLPMNNGLEAPGIAPPVEPMIDIPAQYRHSPSGGFLLTTVFLQTPITVGQWLLGQVSPVLKLVPPERVVPADTTVQELALRNFRMLDNSENSATIVGLRLAGYPVETIGRGARILSVLPESPAYNLLQPGDVIVAVNEEAVGIVSDLTTRLTRLSAQDTVQLQIERDSRRLAVTTSFLPPSDPAQPPRIGISVEEAGMEVDLPFPVEIVPQKIVGGPSAGLIFALTIYNLLTPEDVTGGRIIAGTGTINLDGTVGPIGGVEQKVAGAEFAGAEYFLAPSENYEDARAVARRIKVVKVATADEAIEFLRSLPPVGGQP